MTQLTSIGFDDLAIDQTASYSKTLTEADLVLFAATSGDVNPVHLDAEFAAGTVFGERIGHGMWLGALVSAAIATQLPGPGSVYRSQSLQFKQPVKLGDTATVTLTVTGLKARMKLVTLACSVTNQNGVVLAKGEADVIAPAAGGTLQAPDLPAITID
ncbi:MaoC family dehydratase [Gilvimarinus agarilyticus]|uniref:MaoC family dehydratase n=1 Tax=unclassified Gilvimarinus TaxID=2642066 RepID=UPI001C092570|nr:MULTISPECIES: MaoC family dehydratase [unclassified Gilvimarinus]MBU2884681.1 MaoC family dehydratase [Gilvimarinus agarilyticus]MDO6569789.1 MaoC family dehydratase [Gilvimarinus sp. 2_MG-2023]MDO6747397.1 MaoC family dehydratase [Gilvimarinus sp. 1_MG-2023]